MLHKCITKVIYVTHTLYSKTSETWDSSKKQTHRNVIHYSLNILKVTWNGNSSYLYFKFILIIVLWTVHPRMFNFLFIHWHCNFLSTDVSLVMHANHLIMDRLMDRTKYYIFFPLMDNPFQLNVCHNTHTPKKSLYCTSVTSRLMRDS